MLQLIRHVLRNYKRNHNLLFILCELASRDGVALVQLVTQSGRELSDKHEASINQFTTMTLNRRAPYIVGTNL